MDGKRRRSPAEARRFWELAIDLWSSSGLSAADFCRREGLKESSFYAWQQRLRKESGPSETVATPVAVESAPAQPVAEPTVQRIVRRHRHSRQSQDVGSLVPVHVVGDTEPTATSAASTSRPLAPIEIILQCGTRICVEHGCDHELLHRVLAVLESPRC
jgi:hypothetical protein